MYLSPSSGTKYVGSVFSVSVRVNTKSHETNAYKAVISFPSNLLTATSASVSGSICNLQITGSPYYSNSPAKVSFECGSPTAFSGSSGLIGTVTFAARAEGSAHIGFTNAQIKAADGNGTEVLGSTQGATFTIKPAPVGAPTVSSSTHPNQNSWYQEKTAQLSWTTPSGSDGFSYTFNKSSGTVPDDVSEGSGTKKTYPNLDDGTYYFHVKARGSSGWGATRHFRIRVDATPPEPFDITSVPPADNVTSAPLIRAHAVDRTSGIDHYELSLDGSELKKVPIPYQFERIAEGTHELTIRAIDKAGNYRDSSITLVVPDVVDPQITQPADGSYLPLLESLIIEGTAPVGLVEIYLNGEFLARTESDGSFEYTHDAFLRPGTYTIVVKAVTEGGIESSPAEATFRVDARAISLFGLTFPGWLAYSLLLGTVILLLILFLIFWKRSRKADEHIREDLDRIEKEVERELDSVEKELNLRVEETLKDGNEAEMRRMEHELEKRIEESEGKAKQDLEKLIEKIKEHHQDNGPKIQLPRIKFPKLPRLPKFQIKFIIFEKRKEKEPEKDPKKKRAS